MTALEQHLFWQHAVSLWNPISYQLSCCDRCGRCHSNSSVDWLALSWISRRQQSTTEQLFVCNYWENCEIELFLTNIFPTTKACKRIPYDLCSKSIWNCKYLHLTYCVHGTEISVKHSLLLGKFVYYNQVLWRSAFQSYCYNENFRQTDVLYK